MHVKGINKRYEKKNLDLFRVDSRVEGGKGGSKSLTGCKEEKLEDVWNKVLFGLTIIISKSLTDWDIGFEKNSKSCLFINGTPGVQ